MFFENFHRKAKYQMHLSNLWIELGKTDNEEITDCKQCSYCCHVRPGNLNKEDIVNMAKHFGTTRQEVFNKYLAVDEIRDVLCLIPIRVGQEDIAGEYMPSANTFDTGPCIFLKEKKCILHDSAKPIMCRSTLCSNDAEAEIPAWTEEDLIELGWSGIKESED